jgi:hypothetical protein
MIRCQKDQEEMNDKEGREKRKKEICFPTVTDYLDCKEPGKQSTQSTSHLHFTQIEGLAGHYHLESPVMGNWIGKGAVHF